MDIIDLIKKEQDVILHLKTLSLSERKKLVPALKIMWQQHKGFGWKWYENEGKKKHEQLLKAAYSCMNKTELKKQFGGSFEAYLMGETYVNEILPWLNPKWYSDAINEQHNFQSYHRLLELHELGHIKTLEERTIVGTLCHTICGLHDIKIKIGDLEKYSITLEEHIWYVFNWEFIMYNGRYTWEEIFIKYINDGTMDRFRVLSASIKTPSLWYDMFLKLEPKEEECLRLQEDIFALLDLKETLKLLKTLVISDDFDDNLFIERATLDNFTTVANQNAFLMLLEKIAKKNKEACPAVCLKAAEMLTFQKEKIQMRAAKIILKYGDSADEALSDEILLSADILLSTSKETLKGFIKTEDLAIEECFEMETENLLSEAVPQYEDFDEMLFFINQTFKTNQALDYNLAFNLLPKFYKKINNDNIAKVEPVLIIALKTGVYKMGSLLAFYLSHYIGVLLEKKYPNALPKYQKKIKESEKKAFVKSYTYFYQKIEENTFYKKFSGYAYQQMSLLFIFFASKKILDTAQELEVLSTPTHQPCWIQPSILIQRLNAYEECQLEISDYDFQMAIGRLPYTEIPQDIKSQIATLKNKELAQVFQYHYGFIALEKSNIQHPKWWVTSVLKNDDLSAFKSFTNIDIAYEIGTLEYTLEGKGIHKIIENDLAKQRNNILPSLDQYHVFDSWHLSENHIHLNNLDVEMLLFLRPNHPEYLLRNLSMMADTSRASEMQNILVASQKIWCRKNHQEIMYLFLACGMLYADKPTKVLSAQIWVELTAKDLLDNQKLGKALAKLLSCDFAPLKRFTDIVLSDMLNVSQNHNKQLLVFLESTILDTEHSIKALKKLLKFFHEILSNVEDYKISDTTMQKLSILKSEVKALSPIINKIIN